VNRRSFLGACAALLALAPTAITARAIPRFVVGSNERFRFHYTPFGELDWIDMPSNITGLVDRGDVLEIECVSGRYELLNFPDELTMCIRQRPRTAHY
jgi:hypothetical protein